MYLDPFTRTLQELTRRITHEFNLILKGVVARATIEGFINRLNKMVAVRGGHFEL